MTDTLTDSDFETRALPLPANLDAALNAWHDAQDLADTLAVELKAARASAYLDTRLPEGLKATDATRDAYATAQTRDLAIRAATAAVEAKALGYWLRFVLERALQGALAGEEEARG